MKKSLLLLAVLGALSSSAFAQSSVTVYGSLDVAARYTTNENTGDDKLLAIGAGLDPNSHIGFRGTEDIGHGLKGLFVLEGGINMGSGTSANGNRLFGRQAYAGISSESLGQLTLGRQTTLAFDFVSLTNPWRVSPDIRVDNGIKYTKSFGDLSVSGMYSTGNTVGDINKAATRGVSANYKVSNDLSLYSFYQQANDTAFTAVGALPGNKEKMLGLGGSYVVTPDATLYAHYIRQTRDVLPLTHQFVTVSGSYKLTPAVRLLGLVTYDKQSGAADGSRLSTILEANYNFSRRTSVYVSTDYNKLNDRYSHPGYTLNNAKNTNTDRVGVTVGMRHRF